MKVRIAGYLCFFGSALCLIGLVSIEVIDFSIYFNPIQGYRGHYSGTVFSNFLLATAMAIPFLVIILYTYWTKFGKRNDTELQKLEQENEQLRKQIADIDSK